MRIGAIMCSACACLCVLMVAGCATRSIEIKQDVPSQTSITRGELEARIIANYAAIETLVADASGDMIVQQPSAGEARPQPGSVPEKSDTALSQWSESLTSPRLLIKRTPGQPYRTRFIAEFPGHRAVLSLLADGDKFWIRPPQAGPRFISGALDESQPRAAGWPRIRPQDLGVLLLCDDLVSRRAMAPRSDQPGADKVATGVSLNYISYMETWPKYYIVHIIRPEQRPEIAYSRIWVERDSLDIVYHQLFDASGVIVAEARLGDYKETVVSSSKGVPGRAGEKPKYERQSVRFPRQAIVFWPQDNLALALTFSHVTVNGNLEDTVFEPPDSSKAVIVEIGSAGASAEGR